MKYYTAIIKESTIDTHNNRDGPQKQYAMQKTPYTNEYMLYDFIPMKSENRQN